MKKTINWLHEHKIANGIILLSYFLLVTLPHEVVGKFIMKHLGHLPRPTLNISVLLFFLLLFSFFIFFLLKNLMRGDQKKNKLAYLLVTLALMAIAYNYLFVLATESAHFPQYMILAILLFPLTFNYQDTLFGATLLGAADEAYQYFYLNPGATGYFDFNDVITDLLGAALGLIFLWAYGINGKPLETIWYRRKTIQIGTGIIVLGGLLKYVGILSIYPNEKKEALILLMQKVPESFWSYDEVGKLFFHVVHPVEGVVIIILLLGMYAFLGNEGTGKEKIFRFQKVHTREDPEMMNP